MVSKGGIVKNYGFLAATMNEVFTDANGRTLDIGFGDKSLDYYEV